MENNPYKKICPLCQTELTPSDTIAVCDTCSAHQHISCWQKKMGCTTEGCQGRIKEVIPPAASAETPAATPVESPAEEVQDAASAETPVETPETPVAAEEPSDEFMSEPTVSIAAGEVFANPAEATPTETACEEIPSEQSAVDYSQAPAPFAEGETPAPMPYVTPVAEGEAPQKPKKSKKLFIIIGAAAAVLIAAVVCLVIFLFIPMNKYNTACTALDNKEYDAAYQQFVELGGFSDSKEKAKETLYKKGEYLLESKNYDDAIDTFTQLGDYKNASEMVLESKYQKAYNYREESNYEYAYKYFEQISDYKDSKTQLDAALIMWEADVLGDGSTAQSYRFKETVELTSDQYYLYYGTLTLYISGHDTAEDWTSDNYKVMLDLFGLLPASYEDTATYTKLFTTLYDYGESYLFTEKASLAKQCWSLDFIQSLAQQDHSVWAFLVGNWSTYSGNYYLKFEDRGDEGYYCHYNVPFTDHANTEYIDIIDMTFVHKDKDSKILGNVYDISIIDFNTIRVYSYSNNQTYTLYR